MAYTNAIYYIDLVSGNDAARTALTGVIASDNGSGGVRMTSAGHGLITGAIVVASAFTAYLNGSWKITKIDDNNFDLDTAVWGVTADDNGTVTPNGGSSWADAWLTFITGATAARIAPGNEIRVAKSADPTSLGQTALWTGIDRIYTEISPSSSTNATPIVITKAGHGVINGDIVQVYGHTVNTNANGKWKATKINDDTFSLDGSVGNGAGGATGKFSVINHRVVQLTTAVTQDICNCDTAWTAGTGCTVTKEVTIMKEGTGSAKIVCGTSGAGQILAKYALPASLDLSAYEQISFWFQNNAALAVSNLEIRLYSDAACTALVETLPIGVCVGYGKMRPEVINKGAALSATVQGIALYAVASQAGKTYYLDNIIACKASSAADSITLRSLISKNVENENGDHCFIGIQAIVDKWLFIDNANNTYSNIGMGYSGVTESVTTYKKEAIIFDNNISNANAQIVMDNGTEANHIQFIGGWNTASNTRDGYTVMDGLSGIGKGLNSVGKAYIDFSYFQTTRFDYGFDSLCLGGVHDNVIATNCVNYGFRAAGSVITNLFAQNNGFGGLQVNTGGLYGSVDGITANNNINYGVNTGNQYMTVYDNTLTNNNGGIGLAIGTYAHQIGNVIDSSYNRTLGVGIALGQINTINKCNFNGDGMSFFDNFAKVLLIKELNNNNRGVVFSWGNNSINKIEQANYSSTILVHYDKTFGICYKNTIYEISESIGNATPLVSGRPVECYIYKAVFTNYTASSGLDMPISLYFIDCDMTPETVMPITTMINGRVYHHNYNHSGNHYILTEYGYIENENTIRHTASGMAWKVSVTDAKRTIDYPITLSLAKIYCVGGSQVNFSCWVKKTHATDIAAKLKVNKLINPTVSADVSVMAANNTDWQQVIITLTPTASGVIEFELDTYWLANTADESVYVDDVDVIQLI